MTPIMQQCSSTEVRMSHSETHGWWPPSAQAILPNPVTKGSLLILTVSCFKSPVIPKVTDQVVNARVASGDQHNDWVLLLADMLAVPRTYQFVARKCHGGYTRVSITPAVDSVVTLIEVSIEDNGTLPTE